MTHRRVQFVVYPPNYEPGDGFEVVRSWRQAKKRVAPGSVVHRSVQVHRAPRTPWSESFVDYVWQVGATSDAGVKP